MPRVAEVPTAEQIAGAIPDEQTAVVEFVGGVRDGPLTVFVAQRRGVRARVLPPLGPAAQGIARLAGLLNAGSDPGPLDRELGALLLDSAVAELGPEVTRLVIIPDGPLHRVPFDALRLADGRLAVERFAISLAPSAGVLRELWRRRQSAEEQQVRILALGDPSFGGEKADEGAAAEAFREAFATAGGLPRLPASAREARLVARYGDGDVRLRDDASEAYLKRAPLGEFRVLHFATHAVVDDRSVARTAIALTPGARENGFVAPAELAGFGLHADLVVLSACRTAGGVLVAGEGSPGAHRAVAPGGRAERGGDPLADRGSGCPPHGRAVLRRVGGRASGRDALARRQARGTASWSASARVGDVHGGRRSAGSRPSPAAALSVAGVGRGSDRRGTGRRAPLSRG